MLEKVVNGIFAAAMLVIGLAMVAIALGVDASIVNTLAGSAVELIVSIGVVGIFCAVVYGMADELVNG